MFKLTPIALLLLLPLLACGDSKEKAENEAKKQVDDFALKQAQDGLTEIKEQLAKGEDPKLGCAASESYASKLTSEEGKKVGAELKKICGFDVPMAAATKALGEAEAARAAKPDEATLSECFNAYYDMAIKSLKKDHADDPKVAELEKKWLAVCPK